MRVAFLIDAPSVGGGGEYVRLLSEHLGESFESRVFYSARGECAARVVNAWYPDVIHVNHVRALLQLFAFPWRHPVAPVVFTVHGIHLRKYDFLPKTAANRLRRLFRLALERRLYGKCARLIALTETDAKDLRRIYRTKTPICVIPNGVDGKEAREGADACDGGAYAFVSIARFDFQKGQDVLLRAIAKAQQELRSRGRRTLLIGGGETLAAMRRLAEELGIGDLVTFAGEVRGASRCLDRGRVLIAPSRWEGFPLLLCEAGLRRKYVIASDCPGNRDVVVDGRSGRLFPVEDADALADLLRQDYPDEAVARVGAALAVRVRSEFSVGRMTAATRTAYAACLPERR